MHLIGSRLAFIDKSDMGNKLNDGIVKTLTGCGAITGRRLFKEQITFEPTFQLFLLTKYSASQMQVCSF